MWQRGSGVVETPIEGLEFVLTPETVLRESHAECSDQ
jgi:hypothetical protein